MPTTELAIPVPRESTYIVVWEFQVKEECQAEFIAAYGPDGDWARLFRRSPEFLGVELVGSVGNSARFFTLDHWSSAGRTGYVFGQQRDRLRRSRPALYRSYRLGAPDWRLSQRGVAGK